MDSLRASAMLLGLVYHALFSFQLQTWDYYAHDRANGYPADVLLELVHGFRMEMFFLIGGFFGHLVFSRYGLSGFIKNRSRRIVLPLVIAGALLIPIDVFLRQWALRMGTLTAEYPDLNAWLARPFYLWFLFYMAMLDVCTVTLLVTVVPRIGANTRARFASAFAALAKSPLKVPLLALPLVAIGMTDPGWQFFDYVPVPGWLAYYGLFFLFGWLLYAQAGLLESFVPGRFVYLGASAALLVADLWLSAHPVEGSLAYKAGLLAVKALYAWSMVFGLMGVAVKHLASPRPQIRYLADASYWLYLVHWPVVVWIQITVAALPGFGPLKALGVFAATLAFALVTYRYFVRYTPIGNVLNGPRDRPTPALAGAKA
ncbi:MAG: acyltransferase family protein [Archangiaceae bacterium]|nr:acyltransferase family protein [Archangiaceae bacterium]